jgi:hypothetical protein
MLSFLLSFPSDFLSLSNGFRAYLLRAICSVTVVKSDIFRERERERERGEEGLSERER